MGRPNIFHANVGAEARGAAILFSTQVILANLYGPNWDDAQFFSNLIVTLPDLNSPHLILGGDFNCVLILEVDRLIGMAD